MNNNNNDGERASPTGQHQASRAIRLVRYFPIFRLSDFSFVPFSVLPGVRLSKSGKIMERKSRTFIVLKNMQQREMKGRVDE